MTFVAFTTLAAADAQATGPSTTAVLFGFLVVIVVLAILAVVTQVIGLFFRNSQPPAAARAPVASPVSAAPIAPHTSAADDAKLVVLIAAAVHATLGAPHRIVSIKGVSSRGWASEGRRDISRSHKIR